MKKNLVTVSVGIPAYRETDTLIELLQSLFQQVQDNFVLEKIYFVIDGGNEKTLNIITSEAKNNSKILIISNKQRLGKAAALNYIYKQNSSDFLLTIDADMCFDSIFTVSRLVRAMKDKRVLVSGPSHIPVKTRTLFGSFAYASFLIIKNCFEKLRDGSNIYGLMSATLIRKKLTKQFTYPFGTISDQCYLYAMATKENLHGFKYVKNATVIFRVVETFRDWRILGVRSVIKDRENVVGYFGDRLLKNNRLQKYWIVTSHLKYLILMPMATIGSVLMNIFIRKFPLVSAMPKNGMWKITQSSKQSILNNTL